MGSELWWSFHKCYQVGGCSTSLRNFFRDAQREDRKQQEIIRQKEAFRERVVEEARLAILREHAAKLKDFLHFVVMPVVDKCRRVQWHAHPIGRSIVSYCLLLFL